MVLFRVIVSPYSRSPRALPSLLPSFARHSLGCRRFRPCRKGRCPRTILARQLVLPTPSKSFDPKPLLSRLRLAPISPLAATLMDLPATVANKRLTSWLSPLDATLTKNRGYPHFSTFRCAWRLPRPGRGVPNGVTGRLDVRTSRSRDPAQIEAEEGVGIGIEADLGVGGIGRNSQL